MQIYAGLQSLLGKPLIVGPNNLTWTLEKFNNSESSDVGSSLNDSLAEKYSKLSVALSVMHGCFDPLKNPFTGRDIIDDVIFNSRSDILIVLFMFVMFKRIICILCLCDTQFFLVAS